MSRVSIDAASLRRRAKQLRRLAESDRQLCEQMVSIARDYETMASRLDELKRASKPSHIAERMSRASRLGLG